MQYVLMNYWQYWLNDPIDDIFTIISKYDIAINSIIIIANNIYQPI